MYVRQILSAITSFKVQDHTDGLVLTNPIVTENWLTSWIVEAGFEQKNLSTGFNGTTHGA